MRERSDAPVIGLRQVTGHRLRRCRENEAGRILPGRERERLSEVVFIDRRRRCRLHFEHVAVLLRPAISVIECAASGNVVSDRRRIREPVDRLHFVGRDGGGDGRASRCEIRKREACGHVESAVRRSRVRGRRENTQVLDDVCGARGHGDAGCRTART